jgi:HK97 family phage portal protein
MKLFDRFRNKNPTQTRIKMISEYGTTFYAWNGKVYESDVIRACIRPYYKAVGKLTAKHLLKAEKDIKINKTPYIKALLENPNPYMSGQMLQEKLATQLKLNNNAFAYISRDENGIANEIYPIPCVLAEAIYSQDSSLSIKFTTRNGNTITFPYEDIIHLRQDYNENDVFGESPSRALTQLMDVVTVTDQGIVNAIKNSAVIRWLMKFTQTIRPEDLKKQAEEFSNSYLSTSENGTGVAAVNGNYDVQQVTTNDYVPNSSTMDKTITRLYNFFGTNEKIIQSKYTEDEWNAYYEAEIEPVSIQMANEWTRKMFNRRERAFGNSIVFESNSLQYASMSTKLNLLQMVDRGAMTPNEWRLVMNLGPIEGGDKPIRRLDTQVVK